jgi:hypothetical protein
MIHIATCHWVTPDWIGLQSRFIERNVKAPYRLYGALWGIDESWDTHFFAVRRERQNHATQLNALAEMIASEAKDDDLLIFLDGDAFPIAELAEPAKRIVSRWPLAAVRRDENLKDIQPHPSFCITTVGFWKEIEGDWRAGYAWRNAIGDNVTDVGGNLLRNLEQRGVEWKPLLRSNEKNLHPILFGIYEGLVYHHGAGFRTSCSRAELAERKLLRIAARLGVPWRFQRRWSVRERRRIANRNKPLAEAVFERIRQDDDFFRALFMNEGQASIPAEQAAGRP